MAAVTARDAPLGVASARRSPRYGCALRLDQDVADSPSATPDRLSPSSRGTGGGARALCYRGPMVPACRC